MWLIFLSARYASTCTQICTFEADLQSQAGLARSDVGSPNTVNVADVSLTTAKDDGVSVCSCSADLKRALFALQLFLQLNQASVHPGELTSAFAFKVLEPGRHANNGNHDWARL